MSVFHTTQLFVSLDNYTAHVIRKEFERHKEISELGGISPESYGKSLAKYCDHVTTWEAVTGYRLPSDVLYPEIVLHSVDLENSGFMLPASIDDLIVNGVYCNSIHSKHLDRQWTTIKNFLMNKPISWGLVSYSEDGDATVFIHDFHEFKRTPGFDMFMSETLKLESSLLDSKENTSYGDGIKRRLREMLSNLDGFIANSSSPLNNTSINYHGFMTGSTTIDTSGV